MVGREILKMQFNGFFGVPGGFLDRRPVRNAPRQLGHQHGVAPFPFGDQIDLVGKSLLRFPHRNIILLFGEIASGLP